jgi:hypothetical protein
MKGGEGGREREGRRIVKADSILTVFESYSSGLLSA